MGYFSIILAFFGVERPLFIYFLFELNTLSFLYICKLAKESTLRIFYYYMIQTLGSMVYLYTANFPEIEICNVITVIVLLLKLGAFPFHSWFYKFTYTSKPQAFLLVLTFQKIPPLLVLSHYMSDWLLIAGIVSMLFGSLFVFSSKNLKQLMASSSVYMTYWNLMALNNSFSFFLWLYVTYSFMVLYATVYMFYKDHKVFKRLSAWALVAFLSGLPPFSIFYTKFYTLILINETMAFWHIYLIWLGSFLCMVGYFKYFIKNKDEDGSVLQSPVKERVLHLILFIMFFCSMGILNSF